MKALGNSGCAFVPEMDGAFKVDKGGIGAPKNIA
jgi:hypothetical protein